MKYGKIPRMKAQLHSFICALRHGCAFFAFAFGALAAFATEETLSGNKYAKRYADKSVITLTNVTLTTSSEKSGGLHFESDAVLVIADDTVNTITAKNTPAIFIAENCTLTIKGGEKGNGKLICKGGSNSAAIGAFQGNSAGNIVIEGGIIEAASTSYGAAIGGGHGISGKTAKPANCGIITINGGTVTATASGTTGCGIGGGYNLATCGAILITGGTVTATGGSQSAGIGASGTNAECPSVTITGGTVTATAGSDSSPIGANFSETTPPVVTIDHTSLVSTYFNDRKTVVISAAAEEAELEITGATVSIHESNPVVHIACELEASASQLAALDASDIKVKTATSLSELDDAEFSKDCIENADVSADGTFSFDVVRELPSGASTLFIRVAIGE